MYKEVVDASTGGVYFYNTRTKTSSWAEPRFLKGRDRTELFSSIPAHVDPVETFHAVKTLASDWQTFEDADG